MGRERVPRLRKGNEKIKQGLIQCLSYLWVYSLIPRQRGRRRLRSMRRKLKDYRRFDPMAGAGGRGNK